MSVESPHTTAEFGSNNRDLVPQSSNISDVRIPELPAPREIKLLSAFQLTPDTLYIRWKKIRQTYHVSTAKKQRSAEIARQRMIEASRAKLELMNAEQDALLRKQQEEEAAKAAEATKAAEAAKAAETLLWLTIQSMPKEVSNSMKTLLLQVVAGDMQSQQMSLKERIDKTENTQSIKLGKLPERIETCTNNILQRWGDPHKKGEASQKQMIQTLIYVALNTYATYGADSFIAFCESCNKLSFLSGELLALVLDSKKQLEGDNISDNFDISQMTVTKLFPVNQTNEDDTVTSINDIGKDPTVIGKYSPDIYYKISEKISKINDSINSDQNVVVAKATLNSLYQKRKSIFNDLEKIASYKTKLIYARQASTDKFEEKWDKLVNESRQNVLKYVIGQMDLKKDISSAVKIIDTLLEMVHILDGKPTSYEILISNTLHRLKAQAERQTAKEVEKKGSKKTNIFQRWFSFFQSN